MIKNIPKAWGKGPINIGGSVIDCYVLEDGTPILSKRKLMKVIGRRWKSKSRSDMPVFVGAVNIQPFVKHDLIEKFSGIDFYDGGRLINGYHAEILPEICKVYLDARRAHVLTTSQEPIAQVCEILITSFAKVGITALIYEQLGFEKFKHPDAFRMLIESYLADEIRAWSKEFPDEFFIQLDRIYGNEKTTSRNRPQYYAKFIRKYIYEPLERGFVLKELDKRNPITDKGYRLSRFHSLMSEEKGLKVLRSQIWQILGLLKSAANKRKFESVHNRFAGKEYQGDLFEDQ